MRIGGCGRVRPRQPRHPRPRDPEPSAMLRSRRTDGRERQPSTTAWPLGCNLFAGHGHEGNDLNELLGLHLRPQVLPELALSVLLRVPGEPRRNEHAAHLATASLFELDLGLREPELAKYFSQAFFHRATPMPTSSWAFSKTRRELSLNGSPLIPSVSPLSRRSRNTRSSEA